MLIHEPAALMTSGTRKVAVITGASQGIGAALVRAYRKRGWAVAANSLSIAPSQEDGLVTVAGDIAADYQALVRVNLTGFFTTTQLAVAQLLSQGQGGHVVQVTTSLVDHANNRVPSVLVSLTKGGLQSATKSLAIEFAPQGVRVNAVSLGVIQTSVQAPESYEGLAGLHPLGRLGTISDVVDGVLFLEDAPFVTGEILHIDGGQSAGH